MTISQMLLRLVLALSSFAPALAFAGATSELGEKAKADADFAAKVAANPSYNVRPGGLLIKVGNDVIGAIGVGGGKTDEACAFAGLAKVQNRLQ